MPTADRMQRIAPFRVMEILAEARRQEAQGRNVVHMEIGEPDFRSPDPVLAAGRRAIAEGHTHYTPATGLPALREAIASYYETRFAVTVPARRIIVTPGASGALQLALAAVVNPGEQVLLPDPAYPCNRNIATLLGAEIVDLPVSREDGYRLSVDALRSSMGPLTRLLMLASPANPTGAVISSAELATLLSVVRERAGSYLLIDEIYQGLQYAGDVETALALAADDVIVLNSFSKYFGMTGWRVGWMVVPDALVEPIDRLAQNLFLAAPTPSQYAALAAFALDNLEELERRRAVFLTRRDFLCGALAELGFDLGSPPAGAFYIYADASDFTRDSQAFCQQLLDEESVALTPGVDFGSFKARKHIRFAYTTSLPQLELGIERLRRFLRAGG